MTYQTHLGRAERLAATEFEGWSLPHMGNRPNDAAPYVDPPHRDLPQRSDAWFALAMVTLPWAVVIGAVAMVYSCVGM